MQRAWLELRVEVAVGVEEVGRQSLAAQSAGEGENSLSALSFGCKMQAQVLL